MLNDFKHCLRSLGKAPGFSAMVIMILALGIGSATAVFQITDWILFRTAPYPESSRLFLLGSSSKEQPRVDIQFGFHLKAYKEQNLFSEYAFANFDSLNIVLKGEPISSNLTRISTDALGTLGITPLIGRGFHPEEGRKGADRVLVISNRFWKEHFNSSPDVLGQTLQVGSELCRIVGVLRAGQEFPMYLWGDVFRPFVLEENVANPFSQFMFAYGRLKPGISAEQTRQALAAIRFDGSPMTLEFRKNNEPVLVPLEELKQMFRPEFYWLTVIAVGLLYGIACLNAMNLVLNRILGRRREISVRLAIGGSRWQVARLILMESLILTIGGSIAGVLVSHWVFPILKAIGTKDGSLSGDWSMNSREMFFMAGLSLLTGLVVALVPMTRIFNADLGQALKEGGASLGESRRMGRLRGLLVVSQAALAVVLLAGTGLMIRTLVRLKSVDLGFVTANRVSAQIFLPQSFQKNDEAHLQLTERIQQRLLSIPGVTEIACSSPMLLSGMVAWMPLPLPDGSTLKVQYVYMSDNFPAVAGLKLKAGRWFSTSSSKSQVVISEALAKARFGDKDPIGQIMKGTDKDSMWEVLGVAKNVRERLQAGAEFQIYIQGRVRPQMLYSMLIRTNRSADSAFPNVIKRAVFDLDPELITGNITALEERVNQQAGTEKFFLRILNMLSSMALILAIIGMFSVLNYTVEQRMGEFGVRMAIGATSGNLIGLVMKRGLLLAAAGVLLGIAVSLYLTRFMQSMLFETAPYDPLVLTVVAVCLLCAAAAACWLPARRAGRVDPAHLLRAE